MDEIRLLSSNINISCLKGKKNAGVKPAKKDIRWCRLSIYFV